MDGVSKNITLKDLIYLKGCHKSLKFNELSLNYKGYEGNDVVRKALDVLNEIKSISKETAFQKVNEIFKNEYLKVWFEFQYQYEQALERDKIRVKRIIEYVYNNEFSILSADVPFQFKIKSMYRGYPIDSVTGKVDFVFEKSDGTIHAVNIRSGMNPYSHRARIKQNLDDYSIELLGTALGIMDGYKGKTLYVESWYLDNKDDKAFLLVPEYEHKRGKNIASIVADDTVKLRDRFFEIVAYPEDGVDKCNKCIHKNICNKSYSVRKDSVIKEETKDISPAANPKFTESQASVINHMEGPMCVIAGPGAGKTFTLVNRLVNMIRKGIKPENILVVTFTNKAADEFKERVMQLLNTEDIKAIPNIYTYNALGYTILKENPMFLGKRVRLADTVDRYMLISEAIRFAPQIQGESYTGIYSDFGLIRRLEKYFNQIDECGKDIFKVNSPENKDIDGIFKTYDIYKELFEKRGYISYDMQISLVNELFSKYPALIKAYAEKFKYIMVDEYQDTSADQAQMTYSIAKKHDNIVVVGDDDQSIYGWRGGSNKFMLSFGKDFPTARIVVMNDNFRSNDKILDSANLVIADNGIRYEKQLLGHKSAKYKPIYFKNCTADSVKVLIGEILKKGYNPGDIAILGRDHKRLQEIINVLEGNYNYSAPKDFLHEDAVFQTLYDVLTLYYDGMNEDESFYRFLRMVGIKDISKHSKKDSLYQNYVKSNKMLPIDLLDERCFASYEKYKDVNTIMAAGYKLMSSFKKIQYSKSLAVLNDILYEVLGIAEHKVVDILREIADERALVTIRSLYIFMVNMKLYRDDKKIEYEVSKDSINLLTCHSSKGKEFPVVIIYATEDFNSDEEEVRLFYVSITRAKNTLFFMESMYSRCELLPMFEGSVLLKQGGVG